VGRRYRQPGAGEAPRLKERGHGYAPVPTQPLHGRDVPARRRVPRVQASRLVPADRFGGCKGEMTDLRALRLVCQSCGSRRREAKVFRSDGEDEA